MTETQSAKRYESVKLILSLADSLLVLFTLLAFVVSGYSLTLRNWVVGSVQNPYIRLLLFSAVIGLGIALLSFPFQFYSSYWMEKRYNLSQQSFTSWIWEKTKAALVGLILAVPLLLVFYYFLLKYPQSWWLWLGLVLFFFSVFLGRIAPQVIFPLFYKFEPLNDESLLHRMQALANSVGFKLEGIFRFNLSKTTNKANAALTGLGKSKRIILGDTLLENFTMDEIEAVFAHEAGHFAHNHLIIGIVTATFTSFFSLYLGALLYQKAVVHGQFYGQADLAALPLLSIILSVISFILNPLTNALSRYHERQADLFALKHSSNPEAFISAMRKLSEMNLIDRTPHPVVEVLFHSHPPIKKRMAMAEKYIQQNRG
ncbi:MAG TPA: M48 family peptidase [Calditrichaeota bacterium]|nr:M48 family peptidase [Calditrichota bacterium]